MGHDVTYNFVVVDGRDVNPTSSQDDQSGVMEFEDVSAGAAATPGPLVVVKVVDKERNGGSDEDDSMRWLTFSVINAWDLTRFTMQLNKMRHAMVLRRKPKYSQHFRSEGTFTDSPCPSWSFIGTARLPLRLLAHQLSFTMTVPIQCQYTMEAIGSCRISIASARPQTSGMSTPGALVLPLENHLVVGNKLSFSLVIDGVKGLSAGDFASVHIQTKMSSLLGASVASDDVFASHPINLEQTSVAHLSIRRTLAAVVTPDLIDHINAGYAAIEFFAKVRPEYLARLERFDKAKEVSPPSSGISTPVCSNTRIERRPSMRRCETDFVAPEHHDVLASLAVKQLASDGTYHAAEVIDGVVHLHQGVQRQIHLSLTHTSGKALPWTRLEHLSSSDIRLKARSVITSVSRPEIDVRSIQQETHYESDGTSTLVAYGIWDTASHHCIHLDRKTSGEDVVLIKFTWLVEVLNLDEPAVFQLDLPVRILGRGAKRSSLMSLFASPKIYTSYIELFGVDLSPPLASSPSDLWRLDTSKKHVSGEEILDDWKPRRLSLIEDFARMRRTDKALVDVQITKVILGLLGQVHASEQPESRRTELLRRCIELWQKEMDHRILVSNWSWSVL